MTVNRLPFAHDDPSIQIYDGDPVPPGEMPLLDPGEYGEADDSTPPAIPVHSPLPPDGIKSILPPGMAP